VYVHEDSYFVGDFLTMYMNNFISLVSNIDFGYNTVKFINSIIELITNDMISDVIFPGILYQIYLTNN